MCCPTHLVIDLSLILFSFGFKDGISQPLLEGWDDKVPQGKEPCATKPG